MYKLVAVGGKLRGQEITLNEGENTLGRSPDVDHQIAVDGVSKKHMRVTVNGDTAFVEDLGSSNGTFINGKLVKKATVKDGDKIALPNVIFQIVHVQEKKIIVKRKVAKMASDDNEVDLEIKEVAPTGLGGKMIWIFKHRIMPVLYNFNEQYEWSALVGILLFIFIGVNISLTIFPVLRDSKRLLILEIAMRGKQYAAEVARANSVALSRRDLDKLDTNFLENAEGISSYELFDFDGRIVRPIGKLNTYINDALSVEALNFYKDSTNQDKEFISSLGNNKIGISRLIKAYDVKTGRQENVGVIAIRFEPATLQAQAATNSKAYLESLVTSGLVSIFFFGMLYFLTVKPLEEMKSQIENVLRGKQKELDSKYMFKEISPLRNTLNSMLQRLRELQNTDTGEMANLEEDGPFVRSMLEFMQGAQGPVMVLNSEKLIQGLNIEAEDLIGIRQNASQGQSLLDAARDQGMAATLIDLCDQSANNGGVNQKENYEIGGKDIAVNVVAVMGRDKFAKAFYITFVKPG
ncbi:MAG: FHA domain-containing protein [Bacteriovoracaceae bacterium]|nr:FHA domain-containing protein [Bacteriovoracaceae bacterium]